MELSLEGILETLLVGAIAGLCLLSMLFLFAGHVLRLSAVQVFFRFLLYEDTRELRLKHDREFDGNKRERLGVPGAFVMLLLIASMFGLGIITESLSDSLTSTLGERAKFFSDPGIRANAFASVVGTQVRATGSELLLGKALAADAQPAESKDAQKTAQEIYTLQGLAQLLADGKACSGVYGDLDAEPGSPCAEVRERVNDFYYLAKNSVFQDDTYFRELSQLQSRIDFTRSVGHALLLLTGVFGVIALFAGIVELIPPRNDSVAQSIWIRWLSHLRPPENRPRGWRQHVLNLSATRVGAISLVCLSASVLTVLAWHDIEQKFDKRVFGYFLCCSSHRDDTLAAVHSSYRVFRGSVGTKFEPSSILWLGERQSTGADGGRRLGDFVLVANDKDRDSPFSVYQVSDDGRLTLYAGLRFYDAQDRPLAQPGFGKIEAMEMVTDSASGRQEIFAIGGFPGVSPAQGVLVLYRFQIGNGKPGELALETSAQGPHGAASSHKGTGPMQASFLRAVISTTDDRQRADGIHLADPHEFCQRETGGSTKERSTCEVEGLASLRGDLYIGLRGRRPDKAPVEVSPELLRVSLRRPVGPADTSAWKGVIEERLKIELPDEFAGFGVSALEVNRMSASACELLVMTSCEVRGAVSEAKGIPVAKAVSRSFWDARPPRRCDEDHPRFAGGRRRIAEVQGALWSIKVPGCGQAAVQKSAAGGAIQVTGRPWMYFAHKPEGIALVDPSIGAALVVFDDDGSRKGISAVPDTFPLRQEESVFARIKLPLPPKASP